jgi:DNA polymerase-3 subunit gamma/tau
MDVVEIDAASHGGVDDTRDLRERAVFTPASARFKVYIIDEAHQVSREGFNALLKLVEEPPPHLKFVFATTEPDRVLQTIRSRTHHYAFRLVSPSVLRDHLAAVCRSEGVDIDPAVLPLVVRAAAGSVRDSLSVLDQLLAGAGPRGLSATEASVLLGLTDGVLLDDAVDSLVARDGASLFGVVDRVVTSGHDPRRFATDLLERLRDLMVLEAVPDAPSRGMLEACAPDQLDRMRGQAGRMGAVELSRAADVVHDGLVQMRGTTNPRLLLELVLARALLPSAAADPAALLVRLERVERRLAATGDAPVRPVVAAPAAGPVAPAAVASSAAATPGPPLAPPPAVPTPTADFAPPTAPADIAPGGVDAESVRRMWDEVLRAVRARSRTSEVILAQYAEVAEVTGREQTGRELTLFFSNPAMARNLARGTGESDLRDALTEVVGGGWRIVVRTGDAGAPGAVVGPGRAKPTASTTTASTTTATAAATTAAATPGARPTDPNTGPKPGDASPDDEDLPSLGSGEEAAVALLRQGLGARVVEEHEGRRT